METEKLLLKILDVLEIHGEKINEIHESQIRMESELTDKIHGLYDAREVQLDSNKEIIERLNSIEAKVDVLQIETASVRRRQTANK